MSDVDAVDLFAGPGGWDEGSRALGLRVVGVESNSAACATRRAAGHETVHADVAGLDPRRFAGVAGLIASPPCQAFSRAGSRRGHDDLDELLDRIAAAATGWSDDLRDGWREGDGLFPSWHAPTSPLVLEPLRWVHHLRPRWVALEQVPDVLPAWQAIAETLIAWGYHSTWAGTLLAADYGVPQTRLRAFMLARLDDDFDLPPATHAKGGAGGLAPWVSMRDALGGPPDSTVRTGARTQTTRAGDVAEYAVPWWVDRPATTVCGDPRNFAPGHHPNAADGPDAGSRNDGAVRLKLREALVLQSFPPDYPVQGGAGEQFEQVGNAVPPMLATHVLRAVAG